MTQTKLTLNMVRVALSNCGMTISVQKMGDYRVNLSGGTEGTAYYTHDLQDALDTGLVMASADFLSDEDKWPNWPKQTVKRRPKDGGPGWELGVFINPGTGRVIVYLVTFGQKITDETKELVYKDANAAVADGWRVD